MKLPDIGLRNPVKVDGQNLQDFIYLSCGEEERLKILRGEDMSDYISLQNGKDDAAKDKADEKNPIVEAQNVALRWSQLDDQCQINCTISFGGFNPPPPHRRLIGDLAYLEIEMPEKGEKFHVTACPSGFYVNRSSDTKFDPTPADKPCFSHALLDCMLQRSSSLCQAWVGTLLIQLGVLLSVVFNTISNFVFRFSFFRFNSLMRWMLHWRGQIWQLPMTPLLRHCSEQLSNEI